MQVIDLIIYPIKSMGGISLKSAQLEERGLAYDRRWMLVDESGLFVSQRKYPKLALFHISIEDRSLLVLNKSTGNQISIPLTPQGNSIQVRIWDDVIEATEVSGTISKWFSSEIGIDVKLVFMPENTRRRVDVKYAHNDEIVSFADGYPLLVVNTASLHDLNRKLEQSVRMDRFRPNIIIDGANPFEEDNWREILINSQRVKLVKKSARCVMVDNDPITAVKSGQVLKTLSNYRKENNKVYFGINGLISMPGVIEIGDRVEVVEAIKTA